jgi:pSer/pThr/pTyr-binding forkhead associated (FHA) protein
VHSLPATGSLLLGRQAGADVRLPGLSVSRAHAAVLRVRDGWTLLDLGSRFGTRLNGRLVTDGSPLHPGDVVRCGGVALLVTRPSAVVDLAGPAEGLVDAVGADLRIAAVASA